MPFQVEVQLRGGGSSIYSPDFNSREEAEGDLAKLKGAIGGTTPPDVSWIAVSGKDILAAQVIDTGY